MSASGRRESSLPPAPDPRDRGLPPILGSGGGVTRYYISAAASLPEDPDRRLESEPVETLEEVWSKAFTAFALVRLSEGFEDEIPEWHPMALEDDGSKRRLTSVELAALTSLLEQAAGGLEARLTPVSGNEAA
jgi:hypothetical protein